MAAVTVSKSVRELWGKVGRVLMAGGTRGRARWSLGIGNPTVMRDAGDPQLGCTLLLSVSSQRLVSHIHVNIPYLYLFLPSHGTQSVNVC